MMEAKKGINSTGLKWIAAAAMLLDHVGLVYREQIYAGIGALFGVRWTGTFYIFAIVFLLGRIAFPVFAFQVAEGVTYTRSPVRYLGRLFLFGVLAEIPFRWMIGLVRNELSALYFMNVMFTFFLAVLACVSYRRLLLKGVPQMLCLIPVFVLAALADRLQTDYGAMGVFLVFVLYLARTKKQKLTVIAAWAFISHGLPLLDPATYQSFDLFRVIVPLLYLCYMLLSLPVLMAYNGQKGRGSRYFFYLFYPAHLWLLMVLARLA